MKVIQVGLGPAGSRASRLSAPSLPRSGQALVPKITKASLAEPHLILIIGGIKEVPIFKSYSISQ